ncbi:MAG: hypothetical protein WCH62_02210 [Candidatus Omnitrophota bacterium]
MKDKLAGFLIMIFFVTAVSVYAAEKERHLSVNEIVAKMKTELNLTDEQALSVKPIVKKALTEQKAFFDSIEGEPVLNTENLRMNMRKFQEEENQELSKVLTPEQMKKRIEKQHLRESLNKDKIDFSESLSAGVVMTPQGGSMSF